MPDKRQTDGMDRLTEGSDQSQNQDDQGVEWLKTHTLQDIRELADELSAYGEDVTELVAAVHELEQLLALVEGHEKGENEA